MSAYELAFERSSFPLMAFARSRCSLATGSVSDSTFQRVRDAFGERGVVDLVGAVGYYSLVSMALNVAQVPLPAGVTPPLK